MSTHSSLLRTNPAEPKLRWMLLISLLLHTALLSAFLGTPPDTSEKVFFSPVYTVSLVDMPGGSAGGGAAGRAGTAGGGGSGAPLDLWKGPSRLTTQAQSAQKHNQDDADPSLLHRYLSLLLVLLGPEPGVWETMCAVSGSPRAPCIRHYLLLRAAIAGSDSMPARFILR